MQNTPSSVANDAAEKNLTLKFTRKTVNVRGCYGVDAPHKYCAHVVSNLKSMFKPSGASVPHLENEPSFLALS